MQSWAVVNQFYLLCAPLYQARWDRSPVVTECLVWGGGASTTHVRSALSGNVSQLRNPHKGHLTQTQGVREGFLEEVAAEPRPEG